jgi:hypothetical protein
MNDQQIRDREIRAAFEDRGGWAPSPELAERISMAARATRQQRSLRWMPDPVIRNSSRLMWAAVIAVVSLGAVGFLLVGGGPDNDLSVLPSPPVETPHQAAFAINDFVQTVDPAGVPLRAQPDSSTAPLAPFMIRPGIPLVIADGPVSSGGIDWYYVAAADYGYRGPNGWMPASDERGPLLGVMAWDCPTPPLTASQLFNLRSRFVLGCFGGSEITVSGAISCAATASPYENAPTWSRSDRQCVFVSMGDDGAPYPIFGDPVFNLVPADAVDGAAVDGNYAVTGHYDDARCQPVDGVVTDESRPIILQCRASFIVTAVSPIDAAP